MGLRGRRAPAAEAPPEAAGAAGAAGAACAALRSVGVGVGVGGAAATATAATTAGAASSAVRAVVVVVVVAVVLCALLGPLVPAGSAGAARRGLCSNWTNCKGVNCSGGGSDSGDADRPPALQFSLDSVAFLERRGASFAEFRASFDAAVALMRAHAGVVSTDDGGMMHCTLQYLCCLSFEQYLTVARALRSVAWAPFNLTFTTTVCNQGGDGVATFRSLIALLRRADADALLHIIARFEAAIEAHGVPIRRRRVDQEPLHTTLGVVDWMFPATDVLAEINRAIPVFNARPMCIDSFVLLPFGEFFATEGACSSSAE